MNGASLTFSWVCRGIVILLLGMTVYSKLVGAPLAVAIFTELGVEPWGRYLVGVLEIIAIALLIYPRTVLLGAILAILVLTGAIVSHIAVIGVSLEGIKGSLPDSSKHLAHDPRLFAFAWIALLASLIVMTIHIGQFKELFKRKREPSSK